MKTMQPQDVTPDNFASILTSDFRRSALLASMRAETGSFLPLTNRVAEVARQFKTNRDELSQIVAAELRAQRDDFIGDIVFHPDMDERALMQVYESGRCTVALAHRAGPPSLLERIAREHRIEEAVLTLLLNYYATDQYSESQFVDFVRRYADVHGVRYELENKTNIPDHKRELGLRALAELPK